MNYKTIKETALRWGVSERTVNSLCTQGRVEGAKKFGAVWAIPEHAVKPIDPRRERKMQSFSESTETDVALQTHRVAMPLLNTPFRTGACMETIDAIEDEDTRKIALAEYYFFSGQSQKVSALVAPYLAHEDIALRVSACWLYLYANLVVDKISASQRALARIRQMVDCLRDDTPIREKAYAVCVSTGASVLLHLPVSKLLEPLKTYIHMMPPGLRLYVLYIEAHHAYLNRQYGVALGIAETALALESEVYPIPTVYLHLISCVAYLNLKRPEMAKEHIIEAWKIAQADGFIHPLAELHGLMGGTLEATLKKMFPNDFKRIINLTGKYSAGWRKIHSRITGNVIPEDITATEYAAAMLAARGWTSQEIADHMGISEYTARRYVSEAIQKLNVPHRKELHKYLL